MVRCFFQTAGGAPSLTPPGKDPVGPVAAVVVDDGALDGGRGDGGSGLGSSGSDSDESGEWGDSDEYVPETPSGNYLCLNPEDLIVGEGSNLYPVMVLMVKVEGPPPGKKQDRKRLYRMVTGSQATRKMFGEYEPVKRAADGSPVYFYVTLEVARQMLAGGSEAGLRAIFGDIMPPAIKAAGYNQLFYVLGPQGARGFQDFHVRKGRLPGASVGMADRVTHLQVTGQPSPVAGRMTPTDVSGHHLDASGKVMTPKKARGNPNQRFSDLVVPGPPAPNPGTPPTSNYTENRLAVVTYDRNSNPNASQRKRKRLHQTKLTPKSKP